MNLTHKKDDDKTNNDKDEKALYKLINNTIHGKNNGKLEKKNQCKTSKQLG